MSRQATLPFVPSLTRIPADPAIEPLLRRALLRREPVVLGAAGADPYSADSGQGAFIRSLLEALAHVDGLEVAITTRSPRILQDLSVLTDLDQRHMVRVDVPLPAIDPDLARQIEPREPEPAARLWAVSQLSSEGITTRVVVKPVLPGVNDSEEALQALFEAAVEAGACDIVLEAVPAARTQLNLWPGARKTVPGRDALLTTFRRLRLEHGFPRTLPGRG
ncbi:MAG TPA: radical SAM protein [Thermoanaerobaculia bacterium]|nr:radical SAM protein [Thermoanaerobaculia bacterium]